MAGYLSQSHYNYAVFNGNHIGPVYGYPQYSLHLSHRYTISTLSSEDDEEIENELDIDLCCSSCLKISSDKFNILRNACINGQTFLVPKSISNKAAFMARVFTHPIETR